MLSTEQISQFALQSIESGRRDMTIDELFDQWRLENPLDETLPALRENANQLDRSLAQLGLRQVLGKPGPRYLTLFRQRVFSPFGGARARPIGTTVKQGALS
jgi:hypothetical protein